MCMYINIYGLYHTCSISGVSGQCLRYRRHLQNILAVSGTNNYTSRANIYIYIYILRSDEVPHHTANFV